MLTPPAALPPIDAVTVQCRAHIEAFATKHKLSVDDALRYALDIANIILDVKATPGTEIYAYRCRNRYKLRLFGPESK